MNTPVADTGNQILTWTVKDASRGEWHIKCTRQGIQYSATEEGWYETRWQVSIETGPAQPSYQISFITETQYDQPITLLDVWREVHLHIARFTEAALGARP